LGPAERSEAHARAYNRFEPPTWLTRTCCVTYRYHLLPSTVYTKPFTELGQAVRRADRLDFSVDNKAALVVLSQDYTRRGTGSSFCWLCPCRHFLPKSRCCFSNMCRLVPTNLPTQLLWSLTLKVYEWSQS